MNEFDTMYTGIRDEEGESTRLNPDSLMLREVLDLYVIKSIDLKEAESTLLKIDKYFKAFKDDNILTDEINGMVELYFDSKNARKCALDEPLEKYDQAIKLIEYLKSRIKDEESLKMIDNFEVIRKHKGWK